MKIAIMTPGGVDRSGAERVIPCLLWLIERLVKAGDEVHVFALRQDPAPGQWRLLGALVHNAGGVNALVRAARAVAQFHGENRRSRFDIIHALWAVPQGVIAGITGRILGIPVLLHLPGGDLTDLSQIRYGARTTLAGRLALRFAVFTATRITTPSAYMVGIAETLGIRAERLSLGVALDRWAVVAPRSREGSTPAKLVHVSDLSPVKDQEMLLSAAAHLRARGVSFVLDIIGEDRLQGEMARRAHAFGLEDCVRFHGFLPQGEVRKYMRAADLLVVTSRHEAGPVVALEAAATGVPAVGTAVGFLADWAPNAARTVNPGDGVSLAEQIEILLARDDERLRLALEAQARAVAENADMTTRLIRDVYREMIDRKGTAVVRETGSK